MGIPSNGQGENKKKQPLLPIQLARSAPPTNPPTSISPHSTQFSPVSDFRSWIANLRRRNGNHDGILPLYRSPSSPPPNLPDRIYPPPPSSSLPRTHTVDRYHRPMTVRPNNPAYQNTEWPGSHSRDPQQREMGGPHSEAPPLRGGAGSDLEDPRVKDMVSTVNIRKETITIELDEQNPDYYLVSFVFDAMVDVSISILYVVEEDDDTMFRSLYDGIDRPKKFHFKKGPGQGFYQPSGTGVNLSIFDMNDLLGPSPGKYIFPLVILAEACLGAPQMNLPATSAVGQITQAKLKKNNEGHFQLGEVKQILLVNGFCAEDWYDEDETEKECAICKNGLKNTAILPCRHYLMCRRCGTKFMYDYEFGTCPVCRKSIHQLVQINEKVKHSQEPGPSTGMIQTKYEL